MSTTQGFARLFTVDEANALIPGLRPVVERLLGTFREIRTEIEGAAGQSKLSPGSPELAKHLEDTQDSVRFYPLCAACVEKVETVGGQPPTEDMLYIV